MNGFNGHRYSAAIFDVDGTLRDFYNVWYAVFKEVVKDLSNYSIDKCEENVLTIIRNYTDPETRFHDLPQMFRQLSQRRPRANPEHRGLLPLKEDEAYHLAAKWQKHYDELALKKGLLPGVDELLNGLDVRGVKLGQYSDAPKGAILHFLWLFRDKIPSKAFTHIVTRGRVGIELGLPSSAQSEEEKRFKQEMSKRVFMIGEEKHKPQPSVLWKWFSEQMGVSPHKMAFFGDSLQKDLPCTFHPSGEEKEPVMFIHCDTEQRVSPAAKALHVSLGAMYDVSRFATSSDDENHGAVDKSGDRKDESAHRGFCSTQKERIFKINPFETPLSSILNMFETSNGDPCRGGVRREGRFLELNN